VVVDEKKAQRHNGSWVLDRIANGKSIPWSMGCRVPFDLSSVTPDYDKYESAWAAYDPTKHKSPADAILEAHARSPIKGLSRTRKDYPDELTYHMNEVLPDGRKIFAVNDFPLFFDLSAVGVPADQVAWSMMKIGSTNCELTGQSCETCHRSDCPKYIPSGALLWDRMEAHMAKTAEVHTASIGKGGSVRKSADIDKSVTSPISSSKPIDKLDEKRSEIPKDVLNHMGENFDLSSALSTPSMMGMLLKPKEFRRIVMVRVGKRALADKLDDTDSDLPPTIRSERPEGMGAGAFDDDLAKILSPLLGERSCLGPVIHRTKIIIIRSRPSEGHKELTEDKDLQEKVSALYNGYRLEMVEKIGQARAVVSQRPWLKHALYGFNSLDKIGSFMGSVVPLVTERTMEYLRAV
jgi:hypothetical protein